MRWVRYEGDDGGAVFGIVEGDEIAEVSGDPFDGYERTGGRSALADARLLVPFEPKTFYAAGVNYEEHVREAAALLGREPDIPQKPDIGYRANNALIAHGEPIVKPADSTDRFQYEGELVVVIGKEAKHLSVEDRAVLRAGLHHRQRCQRAHLAGGRPHTLARQEQRHFQADGALDRDGC